MIKQRNASLETFIDISDDLNPIPIIAKRKYVL